ncbi:MAG: hypothetical protein MUE85_07700 [Microscillaceae bacterium]|jgi:hypothetical protein|nr:hypothetical protein [Microscillaceae bacterium]
MQNQEQTLVEAQVQLDKQIADLKQKIEIQQLLIEKLEKLKKEIAELKFEN